MNNLIIIGVSAATESHLSRAVTLQRLSPPAGQTSPWLSGVWATLEYGGGEASGGPPPASFELRDTSWADVLDQVVVVPREMARETVDGSPFVRRPRDASDVASPLQTELDPRDVRWSQRPTLPFVNVGDRFHDVFGVDGFCVNRAALAAFIDDAVTRQIEVMDAAGAKDASPPTINTRFAGGKYLHHAQATPLTGFKFGLRVTPASRGSITPATFSSSSTALQGGRRRLMTHEGGASHGDLFDEDSTAMVTPPAVSGECQASTVVNQLVTIDAGTMDAYQAGRTNVFPNTVGVGGRMYYPRSYGSGYPYGYNYGSNYQCRYGSNIYNSYSSDCSRGDDSGTAAFITLMIFLVIAFALVFACVYYDDTDHTHLYPHDHGRGKGVIRGDHAASQRPQRSQRAVVEPRRKDM
jgi:hypothetical protein